MKSEFTQRLRDLAKATNFRAVKDKIDAYFTLHDEIDLYDEGQADFLMKALRPFATKDKAIFEFCKAFEHRQALSALGASHALMEIKKTKLYSVNDAIKNRVDELIDMKMAGAPEIKVFESYKNEVQGLVLDNFFNKYMSDVEAKYEQLRAYAYVDEAIEELSASPNPELLGDVLKKLEGAMALPASQVPFYLMKSLSGDRHLSPAIGTLLTKMKQLDPMKQRNTMNQIRYVGNAGVYESVMAPVKFGKDFDTVMLGKRLFVISESNIEEISSNIKKGDNVEILSKSDKTEVVYTGIVSSIQSDGNIVVNSGTTPHEIVVEPGLIRVIEARNHQLRRLTDDDVKKLEGEYNRLTSSPKSQAENAERIKEIEQALSDNDLSVDESFIALCEAFAQTQVSESGSIAVSDEKDNCIEIDESVDGDLVLTLNKNLTYKFDSEGLWKTELLGMQVHPRAINVISRICENLESIATMDNIMSLSSKNGYVMYLVKQDNNNHIVIVDEAIGQAAIQKNVSAKEAIEAAIEAFGVDVSKFFGEATTNENAEVEAKMQDLQGELDAIEANISEINGADEEVKGDAEVQDLLQKLEDAKADICNQLDQLATQLV